MIFSDEEEETLLRQITDMKSTRPRLPLAFAALINPDVLIPNDPAEDSKYLDWCYGFVKCFKGEEGKKHRKSLDALRVLDAAGVHIGYTVRRIYEYVLGDLEFDDSLAEVKSFRSTRSESLTELRKAKDGIQRIKERMEKRERKADGSLLPQLASITQTKAELMTVLSVAIEELEKLYNVEMENSRVKGRKFVQATLHNSRLNFLLPPEWYSPGRRRRFWSEIASLMDTTAAVIIKNSHRSTVVARYYNHEQVRIAAERVSQKNQWRIIDALKKLSPDFLDKVKATSLDTAIAALPKLNLTSSTNARLISKLSRKLRDHP